jgi:hypothetical protein
LFGAVIDGGDDAALAKHVTHRSAVTRYAAPTSGGKISFRDKKFKEKH